jgi:hypothetical protein|tara:strand:- start:5279 stop:5824 length:546 start_codon:yes stop_codon:yes gene_type:complete
MATTTYSAFLTKLGGNNPETYIGLKGEIFWNPDTGGLRLSDGVTPGGNEVTLSGNISNALTLTNDETITGAEFEAFTNQRIIKKGAGASVTTTVNLFQPAAINVGSEWTIGNASAFPLIIDTGTQNVHALNGNSAFAVENNFEVLSGGIVDIVCIDDNAAGGTSTTPNYIIYGSGLVKLDP